MREHASTASAGGASRETRDSSNLDISPVWTPITLTEADTICAHLDPPARAQTILSVSQRPTAAASLIHTNRGPVFVKRYSNRAVTAAHLTATHHYVNGLAQAGFPTPPFLAFQGATTTLIDEGFIWEACRGASGEDRYRQTHSWQPPHTLEEAREIGRQCARIARVSKDYAIPRSAPSIYQSRFDLFAGRAHSFNERLSLWLHERPHVDDFCRRRGVDLDERLAPHRSHMARIDEILHHYGDDIPTTWTHGDLHCSNLMWEPGSAHVSEVIDFGLADRNWSIYDLAVAIERNAFLWLDITAGHTHAVRRDVVQALIEGYESLRPLPPVERALLPAIMPLVQAEAALNWMNYQWGILENADAATWSLDVFCGQHTQWFDTPAGKSFTFWLTDLLSRPTPAH